MGIPREDWPIVFKWAIMSIGFEDPEYQVESGSPLETRQQGFFGLGTYCAQLAQERRGGSGEDLLSVLGNAEINGRKLDETDLMLNGWLYVLGGMETTRNAISGGLLALIDFPDQRRRLIANPSLMPAAIEEILRWTSPITHITRTATHETSVGGRTIGAGDKVALWLPSANRDEDVFEDPYVFDLARSPNEHVAFGKGEHFCAGAHLARLELRLMLRALLSEVEEVELAGPVERLRSNLVAGVKHMPVRFRRSRAAA